MEKGSMTNAERQKNFKQNNPNNVKLNQLKQISRRQEANKNPYKAEAIKEANRKRQAAKRVRN